MVLKDNNILKYKKRALILSYFTVGYNILEGAFSIIAGILANSIALEGFGLDSFVESLSGSVMIWRFRKYGRLSREGEERVEKRAARLVAVSFFILAVYILYESIRKLYFKEIPAPSLIGLVVVILSIIVMPVLFYLKYRTGVLIKSKSLIADSKETLACVLLSFAVLFGTGLNYLNGFWQADPIAGIFIAGYLVKEGFFTLKE
ncbi:MAG TPA: cation transporter [Candidatus Hydromicrobium sp.]